MLCFSHRDFTSGATLYKLWRGMVGNRLQNKHIKMCQLYSITMEMKYLCINYKYAKSNALNLKSVDFLWLTLGKKEIRPHLVEVHNMVKFYIQNRFFSATNNAVKYYNQKKEGPLPKMLNSSADGTHTRGLESLPGQLAWLMSKSSTRGRTTLLQPSG